MRISPLFLLSSLFVAACERSATSPGGGGHHGPPNPDSLGPGIVATTTVNGAPAYKLGNGEVAQLMDTVQVLDWLRRFPPPLSPAPTRAASSLALPPSVSLRQYQTPVKDQNPRGTCYVFAALAAIEAQYQRQYNVTLDLSEEYGNLVSRLVAIYLNMPPTRHEDAIGANGYGSTDYVLQVFSNGRLGLPPETTLPYINDGNWENTAQQGDKPYLDDNSTQWAVDDFNLNSDYVVYKIPTSFPWYTFPQRALDSATYRATQVYYAKPSEYQSVTWFKSQLAAGHEVVFGVTLTSDSKTVNHVWMPGDTAMDGHAMLFVGYADSLNAFLVKNSWGASWPTVQDSGYVWMSYDWVTKNKLYEAAVVLSVAAPNAAPPPEQRFLGRWHIDHDGVKGMLDIYRIPGMFGQINGKDDYRLGTYYGPDSVARRVNGTVAGDQIDAYIDWSNAGVRALDDISGIHFTGRIMADGQGSARYIGGTLLDNRDGKTYGFYASKPDYLVPMAITQPAGLTAYLGHWSMNFNGTWGTLTIATVDSNTYHFTGSFVDLNNNSAAVSGLVNANQPWLFDMLVGNTQVSGALFKQESGVIAGKGNVGFVATHSNFPPSLQITYPTANATLDYDLNLLSGTALHATAQDYEDGNPCCTVVWKEGVTEVAWDANSQFAFSDTGTHTVTATATDLDGATTTASVTFRLVNSPPTAKILKPTDGQHFITGVTYNNALEAQQWLVGPPKTITYTWTSNSGTDNFPKNGTTPTGVVFGDTGARVITLTVADNYGLQAQSSVNVYVDTAPSTPVITFLAPLDSQNVGTLINGGYVWVNIQITPSGVQGRSAHLVWQADAQGCSEETVTLTWNPQIIPPADAKDYWGDWDVTQNNPNCFGQGFNGWLRLYVTDPNVPTQMAQVYLFNPVLPHVRAQ